MVNQLTLIKTNHFAHLLKVRRNLTPTILNLENSNFVSLLETLLLLETESAKFAALRRTKQDIIEITLALNAYAHKMQLGEKALEEDMQFHMQIAEASKNPVLKSLLLIIRPEVFNNFHLLGIGKHRSAAVLLDEHQAILDYIIAQEPEKAATAMRTHLKVASEYLQLLKNRQGNGNGRHI